MKRQVASCEIVCPSLHDKAKRGLLLVELHSRGGSVLPGDPLQETFTGGSDARVWANPMNVHLSP